MGGVEAEAAPDPLQNAETGRRGATEFGRARENSAAKLPLPAAADDVNQKSRRLKGEHRFYHWAEARWFEGGRARDGSRRGRPHDWWGTVVARSNDRYSSQ